MEKKVIRRFGRKTASELAQDSTDKLTYQLKRNSDESIGLRVEEFEGKGRGVVSTRDRLIGEFIVEYAGDLKNKETAEESENFYCMDITKGCYMFHFKKNEIQYCVDATAETGRMGRLINHSMQSPNLQPKVVMLGGTPRLILVSNKKIAIGEELLFDYGDRNKEHIKMFPWLAM